MKLLADVSPLKLLQRFFHEVDHDPLFSLQFRKKIMHVKWNDNITLRDVPTTNGYHVLRIYGPNELEQATVNALLYMDRGEILDFYITDCVGDDILRSME